MEYYFNEDHTKIGVLISVGFGAGWSSWCTDAIAFDKRVIEYWKNNPRATTKEVEAAMEKLGYELYASGYSNLVLQWVPVNTYFRIQEYDGAERIEMLDLSEWFYVGGENGSTTD